jgi:hypothetical protein
MVDTGDSQSLSWENHDASLKTADEQPLSKRSDVRVMFTVTALKAKEMVEPCL